MTLEITQYPVFEADQVLSQKHLNNMISYLEEQDRVSRTALLGMGIACGLEIARPKRTEIDISCGTAITSLGFLITLEDTTYTHYKHSTLSDKFLGPVLEPDHYLNTIYDEVGIYRPFKECLELLPLGTKDPEGLVLTAPIIEQSVQPVDHAYTPEQLVAVGRDTETVALARAVKLHVEHRVFLHGNKTVIFR